MKSAAVTDVNANSVTDLNDTIAYSFVVTNTGTVTLNSVTVADPLAGNVTCPVTTLGPGASTTCTAVASYVVTQVDVDAGIVSNTATVSGKDPQGETVAGGTPAVTDTAVAQAPGLTIVKSAAVTDVNSSGSTDLSDTIAYSFLVTNVGTVTLTGVAVADPLAGAVSCPVTTLAPGASTTCTADTSYVITPVDVDAGVVSNTAAVSATDPAGARVNGASPSSADTAMRRTVALSIVKSASVTDENATGATDPGDTIAYTFVVTNVGNVTVTNVAVSDPMVGAVSCLVTRLAPGASTTCSADARYLVTESDADAREVTNIATVSGNSPDGAEVAGVAPGTVTTAVQPLPTPEAVDDTASSSQGVPVRIAVLANDSATDNASLVVSSVQLFDPTTGTFGATVSIPGEGTYTVDPATGEVIFTPVASFSGNATPVKYRITDTGGQADTANITVTVHPVTPTAEPDTATTSLGKPVTMQVMANDSAGASSAPLDASTVRLLNPATGAYGTSVAIPGEGTWTVGVDGKVTFTPAADFHGTATPVTYRVADANGTVVSATITVNVAGPPTATSDKVTGIPGGTIHFSPLTNDDPSIGKEWLPETLCLAPEDEAFNATCILEYTRPGVGTWMVKPDGTVDFTPVAGYNGAAVIGYRVTSTDGVTVYATMTVTVPSGRNGSWQPRTAPSGSAGSEGRPGNPLAFTGVNVIVPAAVAGFLLFIGFWLTVNGRRRASRLVGPSSGQIEE